MVSKKKNLLSLMICAFILLSFFANPISVFAENSVDGTIVNLTSTINVTNDVIAPPETTMNYEISAGSAEVGAAGKLPIYAGIGSPTITSSVTFTSSDYVAGSGSVAKTASKDIVVDFSSVTFTRTGIYRYVVTQTPASTIDDMGYANNRYIDVYVTTDGTDLSATYVVSDVITTAKGSDFENTYPITPSSVIIKNIVAGNQRELDKEFNYVLTVESSNTITVTKTDLENNTTSVSAISVGEYSFSLKGSEFVTLDGLTNGNTYQVVQESEVEAGYTTTYKIDSASAVTGLDTGIITVNGTPDNVTFINTRDCGTPTGVVMNTTPYVVMLGIAGMFMFFILTKRKKEEEYEG